MPGHTKSYNGILQFEKFAVSAKTSETGSTEASAQIGKCKSSVKTALKELDDVGLLVRRSGGFSKPNHLYVKIPSDEIGLQPFLRPDEGCFSDSVATIFSTALSSTGCTGVGNVAPSKVTEKYKRNKYHEVNYCYGEGESL